METSTSIVKRDESLVRLSRVVDERGKVDVATLSEADRKRCREITKNIKNVDSLYSFGMDIANARNEASAQLLEMSKIDKADKIGAYVTDVIDAIKDAEYQDPSKMTGFRGFIAKYIPFGTAMVKAGDKYVVARYESSKDVVDKIIVALKDQQIDLKSDYNTLDNMKEKTESYVQQLGIHYVALAQFYEDKKAELEEMRKKNQESPGTYSDQEIIEAQKFLDDIEKQGYELFLAANYNANIIIPSIDKMKDNANALIHNAEQISQVVIPNWEMSVSMALINKRAQTAADLQKLIKDKNNEMMVANAEMLQKVTITLEKEARRGAFDVESYKEAFRIVKEALKESAESGRIAKEEMAKNMIEISKINKENAADLEKITQEFRKLYVEGEGPQIGIALQ